MTDELRFEQTIQAPAAEVYRMFTNATALREWLCDRAMLSAAPGGYFYAGWTEGYYASGEFTRVEKDQVVEFTWLGRGEPGPSRVQVSLEPAGVGTRLVLLHSGLGEGEAWGRTRVEIDKGWKRGLRNLTAVLENGPDLRIVNRPMMGVLIGEFSPETALKIGVPVSEGVRLDDTIEGLSARRAGLVKNDVIVEMDGKPVTNFGEVTVALQGKEAGDVVEVVYYHGSDRCTTKMELARRPILEMPADGVSLAQAVAKIDEEDAAGLEKALEGVTEEEASFRPGEDEWSAKEVLGHLIQGERGTIDFITENILSHERTADGFGNNVHAAVEATAEAYGTLETLLAEFKRHQKEKEYLLARLPETFVRRKSSFWRIAHGLLSFPYHGREHAGQIEAAVAAARAKQTA